jgi:hypothetical protein
MSYRVLVVISVADLPYSRNRMMRQLLADDPRRTQMLLKQTMPRHVPHQRRFARSQDALGPVKSGAVPEPLCETQIDWGLRSQWERIEDSCKSLAMG